MAEKKLRLLMVGGHPADAFDNAGGTLAHHAERGDQVTALVLTQGTRVHDVVISGELRLRDRMPPPKELEALIQERMKIKQQEVKAGCAIMGFTDVRFLTYSDNILTIKEEIISDIARLIREVRPHLVITHYPLENAGIADHHALTAQMVIYALSAAANVGPDDPNPPWRAVRLFFCACPIGLPRGTILSAEPTGHPDVYIDITDVAERKVKALDCLKSQQYDGAYARKRVEAADGCFGIFIGVPYAEAFIRHRPELHYYLPLAPWDLERANELEAKSRARTDILLAHQVPKE